MLSRPGMPDIARYAVGPAPPAPGWPPCRIGVIRQGRRRSVGLWCLAGEHLDEPSSSPRPSTSSGAASWTSGRHPPPSLALEREELADVDARHVEHDGAEGCDNGSGASGLGRRCSNWLGPPHIQRGSPRSGGRLGAWRRPGAASRSDHSRQRRACAPKELPWLERPGAGT